MSQTLTHAEPHYSEISQLNGLVLLEFGAAWCSYCQAAQALIAQAVAQHQQLSHIKIEDGKGKRLGRQFAVKLWPTLILLNNGVEVRRLVRPTHLEEVLQLFSEHT